MLKYKILCAATIIYSQMFITNVYHCLSHTGDHSYNLIHIFTMQLTNPISTTIITWDLIVTSNELYWLFYKYLINFIHLVMLWTESQTSYNGYLSEWLKIRIGCNLFSYFN